MLARTTDAGATWESARVIYDPGVADHQAFSPQIMVLPGGALVDFFAETKFSFGGDSTDKEAVLSVVRSSDKGVTWSGPVRIATVPLFNATDPDSGEIVVNAGSVAIFGVAVDPYNGSLYI